MKETGQVTIEAVVKITCDRCGKACPQGECSPLGEYAELHAHWGYDSQHDMQHYELHICESCFFDVIKDFKYKDYTESL